MIDLDDLGDGELEAPGEALPAVPHEPITVQLTYPIEFGEQRIAELTFRPLTAKDMMRSKATIGPAMMSQKTILGYAGILSGQPSHIIERLSACDAMNVIAAISVFFAPFHGTGPGQ